MKHFVKDGSVFTQNLDIHIQYMEFKYEPTHTHDFFEFVYMLKGSMINIVDGVKYDLQEGSILFMNCDQTHEIISKNDDVAYINILVTRNYLSKGVEEIKNIFDLFSFVAIQEMDNDEEKPSPIITFEGEDREEFEKLILDMLNEYNGKKLYYDKVLTYDFCILILTLLRKLNYSNKDEIIDNVNTVMGEIIDYIDQKYNTNIKLNEISEKFFYSSSYFSRLFKKMFGVTFIDYIQDVRIKKAKSLMDENYSMEKISELVGYSDKKQFYNIFKKKTGMTPGVYKRRNITN